MLSTMNAFYYTLYTYIHTQNTHTYVFCSWFHVQNLLLDVCLLYANEMTVMGIFQELQGRGWLQKDQAITRG
jgi:hypothetical protein